MLGVWLAAMAPAYRVPAQASASKGELSDAIVARVNGRSILLSDLQDVARNREIPVSSLRLNGLGGDGFRRAITAKVDEVLLVQAARKKELSVDEVEIARRVDRLLQRLQERLGGRENLTRFLKARHLSVESLRRLYLRTETERDLATKVIAHRVAVSGAEIEQFESRRAAEGKPSEEVLIAQILITCSQSEQSTELGREKMKRALQLAREAGKDPAAFGRIAEANSDNLAARARGGVLDWLDPATLEPSLRARIETMRVNEISEPVIASNGFHILLLLDRHAPREMLFAEKFEKERIELLEELREEALIELYPLEDIFGAENR